MWQALLFFLVAWAVLRPGVSLAADHPVIVGPGAAFVMGNGSYPGTNSLGTVPEEDVKAVSGALKSLKFKVDNQTDAWTATEFIAELATFAERAQNDKQRLLFFYYAGHAVVIGGRIWLLPSEGAIPHPAAHQTVEQWASQNLVDMSGVVDTLQKTGATAIVIVLDACRTLKDDPRDWFLPPGEARGSEARTWNLPPIAPPRAAATIVTAYATMNDNKAANDGKYAKALAAAITGGENVTTSRLFKDTATIFEKTGARGQTPTASETGLSDICLAGTERGCMEKGVHPLAPPLWKGADTHAGYSFGAGGLIVHGGEEAYAHLYGGATVPVDDFGVLVVAGRYDLRRITQSAGPFRGFLGVSIDAKVGYAPRPPEHFVFGGGMARPAEAGGGLWFSKPSYGLFIGGAGGLAWFDVIKQGTQTDGGSFISPNVAGLSVRGLLVFETEDGTEVTIHAIDTNLVGFNVAASGESVGGAKGWTVVTPIDLDVRLPLHPSDPKGWKVVGQYEYRQAAGGDVPGPYSYHAFSIGFGKCQ